jgi:hypothetical protein
MFILAQPVVWDCLIVGSVCWVIIGISLAKSTIAYRGIIFLLGY